MSGPFQIFVKTYILGCTLSVEVEAGDTISTLVAKCVAAAKHRWPLRYIHPDMFLHMVACGKRLETHSRVYEYTRMVHNGVMVHKGVARMHINTVQGYKTTEMANITTVYTSHINTVQGYKITKMFTVHCIQLSRGD